MAPMNKIGISTWRRWMVLAFAFAFPFMLVVAAFAHPGSGIFVDRQGQVYFIDIGAGVWKIDRQGALARHPGPNFHWMAMDSDNRFAGAGLPSGPGWEMALAGASPTLIVSSDFPAAIGPDGNLYYPQPAVGGGLQIVRRTPGGQASVMARLPAQVSGQPLRWLNGLAFGPGGALYYTENRAIRRITPEGQATTVAAHVAPPRCASVPGTEPGTVPYLRGLAVAGDGTIYVAAAGCGSVLKVTPDGKVSTVLQLESPWSPTAVAVSGRDVYVLEYLHTANESRREWLPRVRKITADGKSAVIASVSRR